jgi:hypothetical protein
MENKVKELRVEIDGLAQLTKECGLPKNKLDNDFLKWKIYASDEIKETHKSLLLAKAWLGKILGELGTKNPYDSGYKTVEDIVPTQDVADLSNYYLKPLKYEKYEQLSHIEKVDWLRQEIERTIQEVSKWYTHTQTPTREFAIARTNTYNYLCEAKFWLGFELGRIKEQENGK